MASNSPPPTYNIHSIKQNCSKTILSRKPVSKINEQSVENSFLVSNNSSSSYYYFLAEQTGEKTCPGIEEDRKENKQSQRSGKQEDNKGKTIYN